MILRIEVKVDGKLIRVEEIEVDKDKETTKIWNFLTRSSKMIGSLSVADLIY